MMIAVASGKGGTGKTLVATSLAHLLANEANTVLLDLDVEEPNAHLFFDAHLTASETVFSMIPEIEEKFCDHCGVCQRICAFHALLVLPEQIMVFPELCKGCRGCVVLCPNGAVIDGRKTIGEVETRECGQLLLYSGRLRIGATEAPALIRAVKAHARADSTNAIIMDAPPGTSCPAVEAIRGADYTVLVTEATPFGLHDLDLMVRTLRALKQPFGVFVNKSVAHDSTIRDYCLAEGVNIIGELPHDEMIARACARARLLPVELPIYTPNFDQLLSRAIGITEAPV